jgi:uncharacterized membrane protein
MNVLSYQIIYHFIFGGTLIAVITYLANNVSSRAASIMIAFPIGLIPLYLLHNINKQKQLAYDTTITNVLVILTYLSIDYILIEKEYLKKYAEFIGLAIWTILGYSLFLISGYINLK